MAQGSTRLRGFCGEISPSDHVCRATGLATGEAEGGGDSGVDLTLSNGRGPKERGAGLISCLSMRALMHRPATKPLLELKHSKQPQRV